MNVYLPVWGEQGEGYEPIESPAVGYHSWNKAKAVCRRREEERPFAVGCDQTEVWKIRIQAP